MLMKIPWALSHDSVDIGQVNKGDSTMLPREMYFSVIVVFYDYILRQFSRHAGSSISAIESKNHANILETNSVLLSNST